MELAGLPLHPLVVHAAVVLVPLTMVAAVTISFWPTGRRRYGTLTGISSLISVAAVILADASGDDLIERLPEPPAVLTGHELYGSAVVFPTIAVVIGIGLLLVSDRLADRAPSEPDPAIVRKRARVLRLLGMAINVMSAVMGVTLVFLTGHSGAFAVWGG